MSNYLIKKIKILVFMFFKADDSFSFFWKLVLYFGLLFAILLFCTFLFSLCYILFFCPFSKYVKRKVDLVRLIDLEN
jgi:hypothetical protein